GEDAATEIVVELRQFVGGGTLERDLVGQQVRQSGTYGGRGFHIGRHHRPFGGDGGDEVGIGSEDTGFGEGAAEHVVEFFGLDGVADAGDAGVEPQALGPPHEVAVQPETLDADAVDAGPAGTCPDPV